MEGLVFDRRQAVKRLFFRAHGMREERETNFRDWNFQFENRWKVTGLGLTKS